MGTDPSAPPLPPLERRVLAVAHRHMVAGFQGHDIFANDLDDAGGAVAELARKRGGGILRRIKTQE